MFIKVIGQNGSGDERICILCLFIASLEQFNNTLHWPSCTLPGPRTPGPPGIPSNLTQSQHSELREHLLDLETISNIFLILHSQDQHSVNIMGCWIYAQLCLFRPAGRKFNIAKEWLKTPQCAFSAQHPEFKPSSLPKHNESDPFLQC